MLPKRGHSGMYHPYTVFDGTAPYNIAAPCCHLSRFWCNKYNLILIMLPKLGHSGMYHPYTEFDGTAPYNIAAQCCHLSCFWCNKYNLI